VDSLATGLLEHFFKTVGPVLACVFLAAVFVNVVQVGFLMAPKRIKPDLKKISPLNGFKRWFSMHTLVEAAKNIGKLLVVGAVAYFTVRAAWPDLPKLADMDTAGIVLAILAVCFDIFWRSVLAMAVLAFLDWAYQKWEFEKNLKMSKQEVKDEYKQTEGDPRVRARIRSIQREQAKKRMMAGIPNADVVVTNPVHLAVALAYHMGEMDAPEVVAKGANRVAEKIKEIARQNGIPIIEDKPLAQALYKAVEVGQAIPADLYEATATILAHVYRLKNRHQEVMSDLRARR
jgi:flagellar biosynthetic protein FlhB